MTDSAAEMNIRTASVQMVGAMAFFAIQDTMVKLISDDIPIWQLYLARAVMVLSLICATVGLFRPDSGIKLVNPGWAALRSALMAGAFLMFYLAMPFVSLSQAAATFFTGPLFITFFGALINRERVGPRRIIALILGFAGVLVIVQPWSDDLQLALIMPLIAAVCYALAVVITRSRCLEDSAVALSLVQNVVFAMIALFGLIAIDLFDPSTAQIEAFPFLFSPWQPTTWVVWLMVLGTSITHMVGAITLTRVYQQSEASRIAPLEYSYLGIVPVFDLLIWGTVPTLATITGMVMVALAGAFVAWREGTPVRPRPQTHGEEPVEV